MKVQKSLSNHKNALKSIYFKAWRRDGTTKIHKKVSQSFPITETSPSKKSSSIWRPIIPQKETSKIASNTNIKINFNCEILQIFSLECCGTIPQEKLQIFSSLDTEMSKVTDNSLLHKKINQFNGYLLYSKRLSRGFFFVFFEVAK